MVRNILLSFLLANFILPIACQQRKDIFEGTWMMANGTYKGPDWSITTTEENRMCYKILAKGHFSVVEMYREKPDSNFFAAVGTYTFDDSNYVETYLASNVGYQVGTSYRFHYKLQLDRWQLTRQAEDMMLDEVWVRKN